MKLRPACAFARSRDRVSGIREIIVSPGEIIISWNEIRRTRRIERSCKQADNAEDRCGCDGPEIRLIVRLCKFTPSSDYSHFANLRSEYHAFMQGPSLYFRDSRVVSFYSSRSETRFAYFWAFSGSGGELIDNARKTQRCCLPRATNRHGSNISRNADTLLKFPVPV